MIMTLSILAQDAGTEGRLVQVPLDEIQRATDTSELLPAEWVMLSLGVLLIGLSLLGAARWWQTRGMHARPLLTFWRVAHQAGLNWSQQYLLYRIAQAEALRTPLTLLVCASTLRHYAQRYAHRHHDPQRVLADIADIELRLFGQTHTV